MKKCPVCKAECLDEDAFCSECGAPFCNTAVQEDIAGNSRKGIVFAFAVIVVLAVLIIGGKVLLGHKKENDNDQSKLAASDEINDNTEASEDSENNVQLTPAEVSKLTESENEAATDEVQKPSEAESDSASTTTPVPTATPIADSGSESAIEEIICTVINCDENITLRNQPSVNGSELCKIPLGEQVTFLSVAGNGFYQITYNGTTGYSLGSYLSINPFDAENPTYMEVVECSESITLRKTPSTKADEFCQIPLGATVQFLDTAENGFYMISYDGYTGYALASYLKLC